MHYISLVILNRDAMYLYRGEILIIRRLNLIIKEAIDRIFKSYASHKSTAIEIQVEIRRRAFYESMARVSTFIATGLAIKYRYSSLLVLAEVYTILFRLAGSSD